MCVADYSRSRLGDEDEEVGLQVHDDVQPPKRAGHVIPHSTLWLGRGTESQLCHNYRRGIGHAPARWKEKRVVVGEEED